MSDNLGSNRPQTIMVLCHTFLNDTFRWYKDGDPEKIPTWAASKFVFNFILEMASEMPEGTYFAVTSKNIFDKFEKTLLDENKNSEVLKAIAIFRASILIVDKDSINKLEQTEGVIVTADNLSSLSNYEPILLSNLKSIGETVKTFYKKDGKEKYEPPFIIQTAQDAKFFLKGRYPEVYAQVEKRMQIH